MTDPRYPHDLPPRTLWPTVLRTRPELQYPDTLNLAELLLDRHVTAGAGARTAVVTKTARIAYGDLERRTNRIGHALLKLGIQPGDRVGMRFFNGVPFVATWLAVQKIGAIGVSTMPMLRARELAYIVNDSGARVIVCQDDLLEELARGRHAFDHPVIVVAAGSMDVVPRSYSPDADASLERLTVDAGDRLDPTPVGNSDVALIAYTSGSTGVPKGTVHTPADILSAADCYGAQVLGATPDDVFGGHPTLAFTYGLGGLLVFPFRVGASTSLIDRFEPQKLLARVAADRVTLLFCAATTYRVLLQDPDLERTHDLTSLRLCVSAGEPLPASVYKEWYRRTGLEILDGIGSTEMFHIFISARSGKVRAGSSGTPVGGYEARVVDEHLTEVARGTSGLLAVRGPTGCRYWRKPDRQRDYVRGGWNITGDVYQQDADGFFWFQCRNDDVIVCGGYKIVGPEVERVLLEHQAVSDAAVVATPDPVRGAVPKAFVVLKDAATASAALAAALQDHVKHELAPYKYPREIEFVATLPRTETGKLRRLELRQRELDRKAPRSDDPAQ
ncbi:MAG TPA: benzoate-CoA ligase family protein [Vicinamibacterales bacterium]|nr:benzoate-CoA ligase family protein [Vicinamibacterales bacterium]